MSDYLLLAIFFAILLRVAQEGPAEAPGRVIFTMAVIFFMWMSIGMWLNGVLVRCCS